MDIELNSNFIEFNENVVLKEEDIKKTDIQSIKEIQVKGILEKSYDEYELNVRIQGLIVLNCAVSLEPIDFKIDVKLEEIIPLNSDLLINNGKSLDIYPIIWENIVLEIPARIVKENVNINTSGNGWELNLEEE